MDERTLNKINKLKKNEFHRMLEYIPEDQLEMKYGGTMEDIVVFWPPIDSLKNLKFVSFNKSFYFYFSNILVRELIPPMKLQSIIIAFLL